MAQLNNIMVTGDARFLNTINGTNISLYSSGDASHNPCYTQCTPEKITLLTSTANSDWGLTTGMEITSCNDNYLSPTDITLIGTNNPKWSTTGKASLQEALTYIQSTETIVSGSITSTDVQEYFTFPATVTSGNIQWYKNHCGVNELNGFVRFTGTLYPGDTTLLFTFKKNIPNHEFYTIGYCYGPGMSLFLPYFNAGIGIAYDRNTSYSFQNSEIFFNTIWV